MKFRYYKGVRYARLRHRGAALSSIGTSRSERAPVMLRSDDADLVTFVAETLRDTRRALVELVERAEAAGDIDGLPEYEQARKAIDDADEALRQVGV